MNTMKIIGTVLVLISGILICVSLLRKNEAFFNLRKVIKEHFLLFHNCKSQYFVFYGFPILFAVGLSMIYEGGSEFFSEISVILSIILSILFAILSILSGHDYSSVADEGQRNRAKKVMSETVNAIVFTSILCIFLLLFGLAFVVASNGHFEWLTFDLSNLKRAILCFGYYMFTVILLTLFLIIKQMSKLIEFNLNVKKKGEQK